MIYVINVCVCDVQAYRLEPLVNEAYANIRPVKMDSAGSKPSKTALDHAEGPKSDQTLAAPSDQEGGWWMSSLISIFPSSKILVPDPDKVGVHSNQGCKMKRMAPVYGPVLSSYNILMQI